jgi:hypothetical protein
MLKYNVAKRSVETAIASSQHTIDTERATDWRRRDAVNRAETRRRIVLLVKRGNASTNGPIGGKGAPWSECGSCSHW